jgi:hypothetical protein
MRIEVIFEWIGSDMKNRLRDGTLFIDLIYPHPTESPLIEEVETELLSAILEECAHANVWMQLFLHSLTTLKDSELTTHAEMRDQGMLISLKSEPEVLPSPLYTLAAEPLEKIERGLGFLGHRSRMKSSNGQDPCARKMFFKTPADTLYFR